MSIVRTVASAVRKLGRILHVIADGDFPEERRQAVFAAFEEAIQLFIDVYHGVSSGRLEAESARAKVAALRQELEGVREDSKLTSEQRDLVVSARLRTRDALDSLRSSAVEDRLFFLGAGTVASKVLRDMLSHDTGGLSDRRVQALPELVRSFLAARHAVMAGTEIESLVDLANQLEAEGSRLAEDAGNPWPAPPA